MVFLGATVAVLGALCLLNLLLTFGVVRRLREHTELLSRGAVPDVPVLGLLAGERVTAFSALTVDGELLTGISGLRVAGFFSSGCSACPEQVGPFTGYLADNRVPRESVLSVVITSGDDLPSYIDRLAEAGRICVARPDSEVVRAFKVSGFPAFGLLDDDGALVAASYDPARLPAPAVVA
jgi:hypothetical protein